MYTRYNINLIKRNQKHMSKCIGKILIDVIPKKHLWKVKLLGSWDTIIGNLKDKVRIEEISENSITLGVCHSTWAQELFFLSPMLKRKINKLLQEEKIKNIKFKTVQRQKVVKKTKHEAGKKPCQKEAIRSIEHSLTITEHSTLKEIKNPELATALEQFYIRCKKIGR